MIGIDGFRAVEAVWDEVEEAEGSPLASGALRGACKWRSIAPLASGALRGACKRRSIAPLASGAQ